MSRDWRLVSMSERSRRSRFLRTGRCLLGSQSKSKRYMGVFYHLWIQRTPAEVEK